MSAIANRCYICEHDAPYVTAAGVSVCVRCAKVHNIDLFVASDLVPPRAEPESSEDPNPYATWNLGDPT